jgi:hypothetical protein
MLQLEIRSGPPIEGCGRCIVFKAVLMGRRDAFVILQCLLLYFTGISVQVIQGADCGTWCKRHGHAIFRICLVCFISLACLVCLKNSMHGVVLCGKMLVMFCLSVPVLFMWTL